MTATVKWAAELSHVREVSLRGSADLGFWTDMLMPQRLLPIERNGQAQIMITTSAARFRGIRFQELSFCVMASCPVESNARNGAYLVSAFNSCRFFAFCERMFFSTPYEHGDVRVSASFPASIQLTRNGEIAFRAAMNADVSGPTREPSRRGDDGWEGPVFLPSSRPSKDRQGKFFIARISGHTDTYPFIDPADSLTIKSLQGNDIFHALIDSHFVAHEWDVRADAIHAKSKTYRSGE